MILMRLQYKMEMTTSILFGSMNLRNSCMYCGSQFEVDVVTKSVQ